jgi:hypothetical protein
VLDTERRIDVSYAVLGSAGITPVLYNPKGYQSREERRQVSNYSAHLKARQYASLTEIIMAADNLCSSSQCSVADMK